MRVVAFAWAMAAAPTIVLPAPQGRAYKLRKRSNHVTIVVDSKVLAVPAETTTTEETLTEETSNS